MPRALLFDEILDSARLLSPLDKLRLIERLAPDLESALTSENMQPAEISAQDNQYQQGYERVPEDVADLEALMPHLPVPPERWE